MTKQKRGRVAWAVAIKTKGGLALATFDERLPLYWLRGIAESKCAEWGGAAVVRVQLEWEPDGGSNGR